MRRAYIGARQNKCIFKCIPEAVVRHAIDRVVSLELERRRFAAALDAFLRSKITCVASVCVITVILLLLLLRRSSGARKAECDVERSLVFGSMVACG